MYQLYTDNTPNGQRPAIMLEECSLPYRVRPVRLARGDGDTEQYRALNPLGRIPTLVIPNASGEATVLTQSLAICLHLAEQSGKLLPSDGEARLRTWEWLMQEATDTAPVLHYAFYITRLGSLKERGAARLLRDRAVDFYRLMDQRLAETPYLAGPQISIADIAAYPFGAAMRHPQVKPLAHFKAWLKRVGERPAVQRGMAAVRET